MSNAYSDIVWADVRLKHGRRLLMLALASHANVDGECWPSQKLLAAETQLTERQVRRLIIDLAKTDYLKVIRRGIGRGIKTIYQLYPDPQLAAKKADILSVNESKKRTFCPDSGDDMAVKKRTFVTEKADISHRNYSRARSEPIEPPMDGGGDQSIAAQLLVAAGVNPKSAKSLASKHELAEVKRQIAHWQVDFEQGKAQPALLVWRLKNGFRYPEPSKERKRSYNPDDFRDTTPRKRYSVEAAP